MPRAVCQQATVLARESTCRHARPDDESSARRLEIRRPPLQRGPHRMLKKITSQDSARNIVVLETGSRRGIVHSSLVMM
jgi:hypothetical protein